MTLPDLAESLRDQLSQAETAAKADVIRRAIRQAEQMQQELAKRDQIVLEVTAHQPTQPKRKAPPMKTGQSITDARPTREEIREVMGERLLISYDADGREFDRQSRPLTDEECDATQTTPFAAMRDRSLRERSKAMQAASPILTAESLARLHAMSDQEWREVVRNATPPPREIDQPDYYVMPAPNPLGGPAPVYGSDAECGMGPVYRSDSEGNGSLQDAYPLQDIATAKPPYHEWYAALTGAKQHMLSDEQLRELYETGHTTAEPPPSPIADAWKPDSPLPCVPVFVEDPDQTEGHEYRRVKAQALAATTAQAAWLAHVATLERLPTSTEERAAFMAGRASMEGGQASDLGSDPWKGKSNSAAFVSKVVEGGQA